MHFKYLLRRLQPHVYPVLLLLTASLVISPAAVRPSQALQVCPRVTTAAKLRPMLAGLQGARQHMTGPGLESPVSVSLLCPSVILALTENLHLPPVVIERVLSEVNQPSFVC